MNVTYLQIVLFLIWSSDRSELSNNNKLFCQFIGTISQLCAKIEKIFLVVAAMSWILETGEKNIHLRIWLNRNKELKIPPKKLVHWSKFIRVCPERFTSNNNTILPWRNNTCRSLFLKALVNKYLRDWTGGLLSRVYREFVL